MSRLILNALGPTTHILAGLVVLVWATALGQLQPSVGLVSLVIVASLLPDIDSGASLIGRLLYPISLWIEGRFGHRTITHTVWLTAAIWLGGSWAAFPHPDWVFISLAYSSHLLLDMIVGERGVPLFWPLRPRFYLLSVKPHSSGEAVTGLVIAAFLLLPYLARPMAQQSVEFVAGAAPLEIPTATPEPLTIRINHVYDPETEILVQPGDTLSKGQLIADLATFRRYQPNPSGSVEPPILSTSTPTPTPTLTPTPTPTPLPTSTWAANPLDVARAQSELALAQVIATATARPPSPNEIFQVCDRAEQMRRKLWRDQIARDMAKAQAVAWEAIHVQEIDLDILEGDIAIADAECEAIKDQQYAVDETALTLAAARLRLAELDYLRTVASPTPQPTQTLPATHTPTTTPSPSPTATATAPATATPITEDITRIYSNVTGRVIAVRIASISGNETTIEIELYTTEQLTAQSSSRNPSPTLTTAEPSQRIPAVVIRVIDGDTAVFHVNGIEEQVRFIGVDTPETKHPTRPVECFGPEATHFTEAQLPAGTTVALELDTEARDRYGRLLVYVWLPTGVMLNRLLVAEGYAVPLTIKPNTRYAGEFESLAAKAQSTRRGLWGDCGP